jgi:hypothetical protein
MGGRRAQRTRAETRKYKRDNHLTAGHEDLTMERHSLDTVSCLLQGGDTVSTGVKTRGMHAELH